MGTVTADVVRAFLKRLGEQYPHPGTLYLLGGGALCLLGNPRPTLDIDYASDVSSSAAGLRATLEATAKEMALEVEDVPLGEFIPLPEGAAQRHRKIGDYGQLEIYVFDPYSIALSKVARGFESDLQDVSFLLRRKLITLTELERHVRAALPHANEFDINPQEFQQNWKTLRKIARR